MNASFLRPIFDAASDYSEYVQTGTPDQRQAWETIYNKARLTEEQKRLVAGFTREMKILVSSGIWCGDCAQQCPLLARIAEAAPAIEETPGTPLIDLRFVDRDEHKELTERITINDGHRVPVAIFMAEDDAFLGAFGDRTLSRYRAIAARKLGASCPLPGAPVASEELDATLADWLAEIERLQLMLRLSPRLRERHGD